MDFLKVYTTGKQMDHKTVCPMDLRWNIMMVQWMELVMVDRRDLL